MSDWPVTGCWVLGPGCWSTWSAEFRSDDPPRRYHASPNITVEVGAALRPQELSAFDHYLTARWQLYTTLGPVLARSNVEHEPWPCTGRRYGCLTGTWSPPPACPSPWTSRWGIGRRVCEHGSAPCDQWERLTAEPCRRL